MAIAEFPVIADSSEGLRRGVPAASVECLDASTVVHLHGELDLATLEEESLAMAFAISRDNPVLVDLADVDFLDATTIGIIAGAARFLRQHSQSLTVRSPSLLADRIFTICGLDHLITRL